MDLHQDTSDVIPLSEAGVSDAEIARYLSGLTKQPLRCAAVRPILRQAGLASKPLGQPQVTGPLIDAIAALPATNATETQLRDMAEWFVDHVWFSGTEIPLDGRETAETVADPFAVVSSFATLAAALAPPAVVAELYAAAGGLKFPDGFTAQQIAAIRAEHTAAKEVEDLRIQLTTQFATHYNTHVAPVLDGDNPTKAGLLAGVRALADAWEADA